MLFLFFVFCSFVFDFFVFAPTSHARKPLKRATRKSWGREKEQKRGHFTHERCDLLLFSRGVIAARVDRNGQLNKSFLDGRHRPHRDVDRDEGVTDNHFLWVLTLGQNDYHLPVTRKTYRFTNFLKRKTISRYKKHKNLI